VNGNRIYLDAAASTPVDDEVLTAMLEAQRFVVGNASSAHWAGAAAAELLAAARAEIAALASGDHAGHSVVLTSGATEANNLALLGLAAGADAEESRRRKILTFAAEHPAVLRPAGTLRDRGVPVEFLPVTSTGAPDVDHLVDAVGDDCLLVSVMTANNEVGTFADLEQICAISHEAGVLVHTDASQAMAFGPPTGIGHADLVTVSGHKMHGPQGVGALLVAPDALARLRPLNLGGGQEGGLRSGTINTAGAVGLGVAARLAVANALANRSQVEHLRAILLAELKQQLPSLTVNGDPLRRVPSILSIAVGSPGIDVPADAVLAQVPTVAAASSSACSAGAPGPSHVLRAMHLPTWRAESTVRLSVSRMTSLADIHDAAPLIGEAVRTVTGLMQGDGTKQQQRKVDVRL
jgi:cysteine desulfurase